MCLNIFLREYRPSFYTTFFMVTQIYPVGQQFYTIFFETIPLLRGFHGNDDEMNNDLIIERWQSLEDLNSSLFLYKFYILFGEILCTLFVKYSFLFFFFARILTIRRFCFTIREHFAFVHKIRTITFIFNSILPTFVHL